MTLPRLSISGMTVISPLLLILAFGIWPPSVQAECHLNIYVENKTKHSLKIYEAKVKVRGGLWKKMKYWDPAQRELWLTRGKRPEMNIVQILIAGRSAVTK